MIWRQPIHFLKTIIPILGTFQAIMQHIPGLYLSYAQHITMYLVIYFYAIRNMLIYLFL